MVGESPAVNLIMQNGPEPGRSFTVRQSQTIGRAPENDVVVNERSMSRKHARIYHGPAGFLVEDLGSSYGTFVNENRIAAATPLRPGDTLRLGHVVTFAVHGVPVQEADETVVSGVSGASGVTVFTGPDAGVDRTVVAGPPSWADSERTFTPVGQQPSPAYLAGQPYPQYQQPQPRQGSGVGAWMWVLLAVIICLVLSLSGGLVYLLFFAKGEPTPVAMSPTPAVVLPTPTKAELERTATAPAPTPAPTTPVPTPEPVVGGVSAATAEEGAPPPDVALVPATCNGQVEVESNEPVVLHWGRVVAEDPEADHLAEWMDAAYYDVRLDDAPVTDMGPLHYYREEACLDDGSTCGPSLQFWVNVGILPAGSHHVKLDVYVTRAVSDGFDVNPADGEPDSLGPGPAGEFFCDVVVVEPPPPTPESPPTSAAPTSAPTTAPVPTQSSAFPIGVFQDFETESTWKRGDQPYGDFARTNAQAHGGSYSGQISYNFPTADNEFVVFLQTRPLAGRPTSISAWVYGDNSGHYLNVWVKDATGEVLQAPFGQIKHTGWQQMTAQLDPAGEWPHAHIGGPSNGVVDYPISFYAIVLDDIPDTYTGSGVIYVDDLESRE